jgi:type IV pilus assembly protein PilW
MRATVMQCRQQGLSLIELMVAMVIGCFLILGVTQIFINNQKSYLFQQGQVGNQENGRFALTLLSQELLKAGYRSDPTADMSGDSTVANCTFLSGTSVVARSPTSLCLQYQAANRTDVTCQGTALSAASQALIQAPYAQANPKVIEQIALDTGTNSITCTVGSATQQLVSGVKDLRFEYGTTNGFSPTPNAADTIVSVRYSVLMQSPGTGSVRDTGSSISPALDDWNTRYSTTYNDTKSIYQIVQGTVMLRNQAQ